MELKQAYFVKLSVPLLFVGGKCKIATVSCTKLSKRMMTNGTFNTSDLGKPFQSPILGQKVFCPLVCLAG